MTQNDVVLKHLKKQSITSYDAFLSYGITRLAARIYEIRMAGIPVVSTPTEDDKGKIYSTYSLDAVTKGWVNAKPSFSDWREGQMYRIKNPWYSPPLV
tara:strand:+ start:32 stop:325 length:294 start_codon:yes stop_codon:yes gene_type:complete